MRLETPTKLDVTVAEDGDVTITADPLTAARLAGRSRYGMIQPTREALELAIARAWYAAGCPTAGLQ